MVWCDCAPHLPDHADIFDIGSPPSGAYQNRLCLYSDTLWPQPRRNGHITSSADEWLTDTDLGSDLSLVVSGSPSFMRTHSWLHIWLSWRPCKKTVSNGGWDEHNGCLFNVYAWVWEQGSKLFFKVVELATGKWLLKYGMTCSGRVACLFLWAVWTLTTAMTISQSWAIFFFLIDIKFQ